MLTVTAIAGTKGKPGVMNITLFLKFKKYINYLLILIELLHGISQFTYYEITDYNRIDLPILRFSTDGKKYTDYGEKKDE